MIAQLTGQITYRDEKMIILEVAGVGYKLALSAESLRQLPKSKQTEVKLWTHLAVRENALDLYGFATKLEHDFFELLLSVSGIGPKSAISILSLATPDVLSKAIATNDSSYLTKVSGIGRKNAEKIVLELKDKLIHLGGSNSAIVSTSEETEAIEALQALGYSLRDSRDALKNIPAKASTSEKVKLALKDLSQK